jgi:TolB-like protein/tetratricopeptide (TPR) repeat protein
MTEQGGGGGFLAELRRRNVFKVAMVYVIASWVLIQVAETTFPALRLPDWTVTFVVLLLALLFPIALIFAWAFELTPEGLKRSDAVAPEESVTTRTGQRINQLIIAALVVAVIVLVATHRGIDFTDEGGGEAASASIAVLPFINMSNDPGNEYFSDGLSEELLNTLAQVDGLRVAARTSSFHFKNTTEDLREVARKLGVDNVLEGSVRKSGNRIRATAQLVKAEDGFHLWSQTFDYEVDDVFRIQDEIALAVVDALKVNLLGEERERLTQRATTSVEAHNLYLRGRQSLHRRTLQSLEQAQRLFERAVQEDPSFALAYSGLSDSIQLLSINHGVISARDADAQSRPLLERAVELDPRSAEVWASIGLMEMQQRNTKAAEDALKKAIELNPSYASGYLWYASLRSGPPFDDDEGALELYRKVLTIDPLSRVAQQNVGAMLMSLGRIDEAEAEFRRALTLDPEYTAPYGGLGNIYQNFRYRLDQAHYWFFEAYERAPADLGQAINMPIIYQTLGMNEEFERWTTRLHERAPTHPLGSALPVWQALVAGDAAVALARFERLQASGRAAEQVLEQLECGVMALADTPEDALGMLRRAHPALFGQPAVVDDTNGNSLEFCAIRGLMAIGDAEQAAAIAAAARDYAEAQITSDPNRQMYLGRLAINLGREQDAIDALRTAVDAGWLGSFNWALPLREDPTWAAVADRPEVIEISNRIQSKLAAQREAVEAQLAERGAAGP